MLIWTFFFEFYKINTKIVLLEVVAQTTYLLESLIENYFTNTTDIILGRYLMHRKSESDMSSLDTKLERTLRN